MKRVIAALLLLVTAVSISVWSGITFKKEMDSLAASIKNLIVCSEKCSDKELEKETQKLVHMWNNSSELLHSLVVHEEMDKLEEAITSLPLILRYSEKTEFVNKCIEAVNIISNLTQAEKLNLGNVL